MVLDLTLPLYPGMPVYPGDPSTAFSPVLSYDPDGFAVHALTLGTHAGTHIDAPVHRFPHGIAVDALTALQASTGDAFVINIENVSPGGEIFPSDFGECAEFITPGSRVLLATGWSERFGMEGYYDCFPSISTESARLFAERGISLLGVETPSLHITEDARVHETLLSAGTMIVESLANLRNIAGKRVFFSAAPLKLEGLDGSPVRAYAILKDGNAP